MHECPYCGQTCDCDGEDVWNDYAGRTCRHDCEDEDDYEDVDGMYPVELEACVDCGDPHISTACECCGGWLCHRHAETGAGFCKSCPTKEWIDEHSARADTLSPQSSSLSPGG